MQKDLHRVEEELQSNQLELEEIKECIPKPPQFIEVNFLDKIYPSQCREDKKPESKVLKIMKLICNRKYGLYKSYLYALLLMGMC